jgi:magnesium chelatase family protein
MALARSWAVALHGVAGHLIGVEADIANGLPGTTVIGLGDTAVAQARDRVRAAVLNAGYRWPPHRITLALSPAGIPKRGAGFDLAMAVALLAADGAVPAAAAERAVLVGELGLDGAVRPVPGVLPCLLAAMSQGRRLAIVAGDNLAEAGLAEGMTVRGVRTLSDLVRHLRGDGDRLVEPRIGTPRSVSRVPDMADVVGQPEARAALELAAAGGHHVAMIGPPGAGKTMLASRLPGLLPPLDADQALEVTAIHSVAGRLDPSTPLIDRPPFVDPHHSASLVAMVGGGSGLVRPGSISLAHRGVLFLDEAPEFKPSVLDALRQPMESGSVLVARSSALIRFPSRFQLVVAANPCPCAAARDIDCTCAAGVRRRYLSRLSGPLMDRIDIRVDLPAVDLSALASSETEESSAAISERVLAARERAAFRWREHGWTTNAEASPPAIRHHWRSGRLGNSGSGLLDRAMRLGRLTGRGYDRVLRLALTSADLAERASPDDGDVATALALRCGEAA